VSANAWPLFGLTVTTPALSLRVPYDRDLIDLGSRAAGRVPAPEQAGFMGPWTQLPPGEFERSFMTYHWSTRATWTVDSWSLQFNVHRRGSGAPPE
jgi:hypothetical protein